MKAAARSLDFILDTSPAASGPALYLELLHFGGVLVRVGMPPAKESAFTYDWLQLIFTSRTIAGSVVTGSRARCLIPKDTHVSYDNDRNRSNAKTPQHTLCAL